MKKFISIILAVICLTIVIMPTIHAEESNQYDLSDKSTYTEYFDDGSYIVKTIYQSPTPKATTYVKSGYTKVDLFNSKNELQWTYTLIGTFQVTTGVSVVCTDSTYTIEIFDNNWKMTDHNNSYSGNTAYGTATMKKKVLFITTNTYDINIHVSCDVNGNIS